MSRVIRAGARNPVGRRANLLARIGLLAAGVWLTIAPFALTYRAEETTVAATINDTLTGVVVVTLALFSILVPGRSPRLGDHWKR